MRNPLDLSSCFDRRRRCVAVVPKGKAVARRCSLAALSVQGARQRVMLEGATSDADSVTAARSGSANVHSCFDVGRPAKYRWLRHLPRVGSIR